MEHTIKELKKAAKNTRLTVTEKAEMKRMLLFYTQANPQQDHQGITPSPFFSLSNFRNKKVLSGFVMGGLLLGSSVSFAAENTVPGDLLYPVKTNLNERVLGAMAVTPKAKAAWEVQLVDRRLQEVEKIATILTATPEVQQLAEKNFAESTRRVNERIAQFEAENNSNDAIIVAGELSRVLRTHEEETFHGLSSQVVNTNASSTITSPRNSAFIQLNADLDSAEKKQHELEDKYHSEQVGQNMDARSSQEQEVAAPHEALPLEAQLPSSGTPVDNQVSNTGTREQEGATITSEKPAEGKATVTQPVVTERKGEHTESRNEPITPKDNGR